MSLLKRIFGNGKNDKAPTSSEAIQRLIEVEEMLNKKSEFLEKKIETQINIAKSNGTKNKRAALKALKTKRNFEKQLQQIDGTLTTIEYQRESLQNASANTEVFNVLRVANQALQGIHKQLDVDEVHRIMDEATEQRELSDEISDLISNSENFGGQIIDEDELLEELEALEQEELNAKLNEIVPSYGELPSVPSTEPDQIKKTSKDQSKGEQENSMEELKIWAS